MKLREGLKFYFENKKWTGEIPEDVFARLTKDWDEFKIQDFIGKFGIVDVRESGE